MSNTHIDYITIIVEPDEFHIDENAHNTSEFPSPVEYLRLFDLKKQLSERLTVEVHLVNDFLYSAPSNGFVILHPRRKGFELKKCLQECPPKLLNSLYQRLFLINIPRATAFDLLNTYNLIGAIEDIDLSYWWECKNRVVPKQSMHGLTKVAKEMKTDIPRRSGDYCHFEGNLNESLPNLLIRYLKAYGNFSQPFSEF